MTDPSRSAQVQQDKATISRLLEQVKPHHQVTVAVYSDMVQLLEPKQTNANAVTKLLESVPVRQAPANLGAALKAAMDLPTVIPAERRAIIMLTDGHSDDQLNSAAFTEEAKRYGIRLYFIVAPGERANRLPELKSCPPIREGNLNV